MRHGLWMPVMAATFLAGTVVGAHGAAPQLALEIRAEKEVREGQVTKLVPADVTSRDDVIVYTLTYANRGTTPLKDPAIVDPVPQGTVYLDGSAAGKGAQVTFSIDGGKTFSPPPLMRAVTRPDGSTAQEAAPPESYTHVRWLVAGELAPSATGQVSFKVKVK